MIIRPTGEDLKNIGYYLGKIMLGLGMTMVIPVCIGVALKEFNPVFDFTLTMGVTFLVGLFLTRFCFTDKDLNWMQGMIVVSLSWLAAMILGAVPLYLSGHWQSFLDACFDSMSGFATTGLTLVRDLDHLSYTHNFWRHLIMFIGGQGIVIVALSFFVKGHTGVFKMYVGEARDEKILPNVIHTSRFIWLVSFVYLILGTAVLCCIGIASGIAPFKAFFHGVCIFITAFDTGGFAPHSQNILYYHSAVFEIATIVIMILGALNFRLHYHIWSGNRRELVKNIETRAFIVSVIVLFIITAVGLNVLRTYPNASVLFHKGFYQLISGHTGTGFMTVYAQQFNSEWSDLSLGGIMCAMALGGAVCSTTGAIKMLRIGVVLKAVKEDLKHIILPERALVVQKYHHIKDVFVEDKVARSALLITLLYLLLYGLGTLAGLVCGYPLQSALFESTSAAANVGLSCGITSPDMPAALKVIYIIEMWAGRLEFMSVFTLLGFFMAAVRGK